ncbi:hypothetical protein DW194_14605 [Subdoligranulum sp. AM16-9]|nr:hypothetical protein DW194_14605 [Subdoligranulum sp. AM16-9]
MIFNSIRVQKHQRTKCAWPRLWSVWGNYSTNTDFLYSFNKIVRTVFTLPSRKKKYAAALLQRAAAYFL